VIVQKVTPFLWFDHEAEDAARLYVSLFDDGEITDIAHGPPGGRDEEPRVWSVNFRLGGQAFIAFNGGPDYAFTPAVSMFVDCEDQAEVDRLWAALTDGGEESRCGWLVDRFGLSWQIVPTALGALLSGGGDAVRATRVMDAMLAMGKLDIAGLQAAYDG
jgi:predicted 3-demethylubiquinone-9 3-methyltransferase (glyoxalase superfamily)